MVVPHPGSFTSTRCNYVLSNDSLVGSDLSRPEWVRPMPVQALITAGRADIATGQTTVEALLNRIIGEQNTAAAAEAAAASALAAIQSLTTQQAAAAESIATAYTASLQQIEVSHGVGSAVVLKQTAALLGMHCKKHQCKFSYNMHRCF